VGAGLLAAAISGAAAAQAPQSESLTGLIKSDSGAAIPNASITVTPAGAGFTASVTVRSQTNGRWTATMPVRAAEYYVTVNAIGWVQQRTTVRSSGGAGPMSVPDFTLKRAPVVLGAVRVTESRRQAPQRDILVGSDIAQTEKGVLASSEVFAAADQGDLLGMVSQVPGITLTSDGSGVPSFSVLGLSGAQNNVTLNGLAYGGSDVPRDIIGAVRVSASTYDVTRGGYSGAQLSITQAPGNNFKNQIVHATLDAPTFQATDRVGRQLGQQYTNAVLSGGFAGPIVYDRVFYNVSLQGGRKYSDLASLLTGDPATLAGLGVSRDSVAALTAAAAARGIPISAATIPDRRQTDQASMLARFDWTPSTQINTNITTSLRHNKSLASFVSQTALPGHGGDLTRNGGDVTGELSIYFDSLVLNDTRIGYHSDITRASPYTNLPDARVLVTSQLADGSTGLTSLLFGGNSGLPRHSRVSGTEFWNQTSWNSVSNAHRWRLTLNARLDALEQTQGANALGTFTYNSIADVQANRPASFARSFARGDMVAKVNTASIALGDQWKATDRINVSYGLRVDGNSLGNALAYNPTVDSVFHLRTDHAPREIVVSPRASFQWGIGNNGTTGIPGFGAPWGFLSGGFGEFRNDIRPGLLAPVVTNTGLPDALGQLLCVGSAVPIPDFAAYGSDDANIPTSCASGAPSAFVSARPNVWAIDPSFQSQRSWRGNLTFRGPFITKLFRFSADATYSLNLDQQSPIDVNFNGAQRASLSGEAGRPMYVQTSSIVPSTGAVTNVDSRVSSLFGAVNALHSDLRSRAAQYTFGLNPVGISTNAIRWTMTYTYADVREQSRGFGGTTSGDPRIVEWSRGSITSRHVVNVNMYSHVKDWFSMAHTGRASSGTPFTPVVAGDVNGDGYSNDRAFIFSPTSADPLVANGMSQLLSHASSRTRECLTSQMGTIAARNSCVGPWTATASAQFTLNPEKLGWDNRAILSLNIANPLAGVDALVHGSSHMQGWGQPALPDATLLRVRGYDPTTNAFRYEVNQRFGDTRFASSALRLPFVMTLEARIQLGGDNDHQGIDNIIGPGRTRRGEKRNVQQIRAQLINSVFNPLRGILQVKDSLSILSQQQIDRLTILQRQLLAKQDTIWAPTVQYLSKLPDKYDLDEAVETIRPARQAAYDAMVAAMIEVSKILTPEQIADFPPALRSSFDIENLKKLRPTKGFFPNY
jgi:hypothetical protein